MGKLERCGRDWQITVVVCNNDACVKRRGVSRKVGRWVLGAKKYARVSARDCFRPAPYLFDHALFLSLHASVIHNVIPKTKSKK